MKATNVLRNIILVAVTIYAISMPAFAAKSNLPDHLERAMDTISTEHGISIISELASDKYGGRLTGSPGQWEAARFIRDHFIKARLKPFGGLNDFYQDFSLATNQILPTPILEVKTGDYEYTKYEFGKNFICRGFTGSGDIRAEVVFCGFGITTDEYDDYAGIDVEGKIVMVLAGSPSLGKKMHIPYEWDLIGKKANLAKENGAAGMITLRVLDDGRVRPLIGSVLWGDYPHLTNFPVVVVDRFIALDILDESNLDLPVLMGLINQSGKPMSFATGTNVHLKVDALYDPIGNTANVIGLLEGSDPNLKNEYVVLGAHMDHAGTQGADVIFPGANDNASGVAALIEIAQVFKETGLRPRRSIIFIAFTGEEMGLKGSKYFVDNLPFSKDRIKYMVNMDMLGDGNGEMNSFSRDHPQVTKFVKRANSNLYDLKLNIIPSGFGSDHVSFHEAGIPCTMLLNAGDYSYPYFHQQYIYREWMINIDLWKKVADTAFLTVWYMAN